MRDADAFLAATEEYQLLVSDPSYGLDALSPADIAEVTAYAAAFREDAATVLEQMPAIMEGIEQDATDPEAPALLYYLIADYEEAARRLRTLHEDGDNFGSNFFLTFNTDIDPGMKCQPDYQAMWELPGMPELAAIRRADGATGNLPLSGEACE